MRERVCKISLFSAILASITTLPVDARVNVSNASRSYADAYNQVNMLRYQQEYMAQTAATAVDNLPVMVSDEKLASEIANNTSETTLADLDACAMIWPNGTFRWEIPESGIRHNPINQCVAVISLVNGNTKEVLATTTVAAGDTIKCNIDYFPESGMNKTVVEGTVLPTDTAPTMEDVEAVMNAEQKQNAGIKIAAGAIIAGVAGNILSKKEAGDTKLLGYTGTRLRDTAIGAATGASIMAASSYSGKVAGDTINSVAVNAASGMLVGNMLAGANGGGDSFLDIKKCKITDGPEDYKGEHDCIAGKTREEGSLFCSNIYAESEKEAYKKCINHTKDDYLLVSEKGKVIKCEMPKDTEKAGSFPQKLNCTEDKDLLKIVLVYNTSSVKSYKDIFGKTVNNTEFSNLERYYLDTDTNLYTRYGKEETHKTNSYFLVKSGKEVKNSQSAYIVFKDDVKENIKGYKKTDLADLQKQENAYYKRNADGNVGALIESKDKEIDFNPLTKDAEDGGLIDLSNQARVGGTLVGTATGGAMGGFAGYQGAKTEIANRWTNAVREYEDSLSNFACMSGGRYLGKYNDYVEVPELKKTEEENK